MIVPKRAALLLDRLMVALHHALEQERNGRRRISDFYASKNANFKDTINKNNGNNNGIKNTNVVSEKVPEKDVEMGSPHYSMYSDDDPTVMMDYDFKDLNAINRATGETLMAKSFQRRAKNMGGIDISDGDMGADGMALLTSSAGITGDDVGIMGSGGGGGVGRNIGTGGRMYWRCYFNAVSCF